MISPLRGKGRRGKICFPLVGERPARGNGCILYHLGAFAVNLNQVYLFTRIGGAPSSGETSLTRAGTAHSLSGLASNLKIYMDCMA